MEVIPYGYVSRNYLIKYYFRKKFLAEKNYASALPIKKVAAKATIA